MSASTKDLLALSEGILADPTPVKEVPVTNPMLDDGLKAVVVPDSYVDQVLGFAGALRESTKTELIKESKVSEKPVQISEAELLEQKIQDLVERLKSLLGEAKDVLQEMTTVGSLGVGPQKKMSLKKTEYPPKPSKSMKYGNKITSAYGSRKSNKGN
tara:strand:+ start:34561 stop:35031 length:471 start_codon:yes stop_codon:yes gene_type:complete